MIYLTVKTRDKALVSFAAPQDALMAKVMEAIRAKCAGQVSGLKFHETPLTAVTHILTRAEVSK